MIALMLLAPPLAGNAQTAEEPPAAARPPRKWSRLHLPEPVGHHVAAKALDRAVEWLTDPDCANTLSAFTDQSGQPLSLRLASFAVDMPTYLTMVVFVDGSRDSLCTRGAFAFTSPGSRVVRLCVDELKRVWSQDPRHAVARVIHEMLHTLGQGEDPPSSAELTRMVMDACGPRKGGRGQR